MIEVIAIVVAGVAMLDAVHSRRKQRALQDEINRLQLLPPSTSTAQLADDFRSFVESVDGRVSPELDALLQQAKSTTSVLPEVRKPKKKRPKDSTWDLFWADFSITKSDFYRMEVLERWAPRLSKLTGAQRKVIMTRIQSDFYRQEAADLLE